MRGRLPPEDALRHYLELGSTRSYRAVAARFGVHRSTVLAAAKRGEWQKHARAHDATQYEKERAKSMEDAEAARTRQLAIVRHLLAKALEALKAKPLSSPKDYLKAIELGLVLERDILGKPEESGGFQIQ